MEKNSNNSKLVSQITTMIWRELALSPLLGAELEFYLESHASDHPILLMQLENSPELKAMIEGVIEKERGLHQYEIKFAPESDPLLLAKRILDAKYLISNIASRYNIMANFTAKPHPDQPGSALHIHVNLLDQTGRNVFMQPEGGESLLMQQAIAGLCATMNEAMVCFADQDASYNRFVPHYDAPTTVSWGGNNRTTALRIPDSNQINRRIEHRVAGSDSDPFMVLTVILFGMYHGIKQELVPPERIYGIASDVQYNLEALPSSLAQANWLFEHSTVLRPFILKHTVV